jgi:hypothetical protein
MTQWTFGPITIVHGLSTDIKDIELDEFEYWCLSISKFQIVYEWNARWKELSLAWG